MNRYNPYAKKMRRDFTKALQQTVETLFNYLRKSEEQEYPFEVLKDGHLLALFVLVYSLGDTYLRELDALGALKKNHKHQADGSREFLGLHYGKLYKQKSKHPYLLNRGLFVLESKIALSWNP